MKQNIYKPQKIACSSGHLSETHQEPTFIRKLWITCLLILSGWPLMAQTTIRGLVTDVAGDEPLIGASVLVKTTKEGVATDLDGRFELKTTASYPVTLVISYVGYDTRELVLKSSQETDLKIQLSGIRQLDEVVITGYNTQEKRSVVGAISKVQVEDIKQLPVASVDAQIQGMTPGVQVNSNSGVPGGAIHIRVRGATSINASNEPLYVVDGVFINNKSLSSLDLGGKSTSPLADINPSDIESIQVLKDASATAIYGSRGANGVVIITTKRGNYNAKPKIHFNSNNGVAWAPKERFWDIVTGPEHAELVNEMWINSGKDNPALNRTYENRPFRSVSEVINGQPGRGLPEEQQTYDRLSDLFRTGILQSYDLSVDGGSASTKYYVGGAYTKQEATMKVADFQRASFKLNLDQKVNNIFSVGTTNTVSYTHRNQLREGTGPQAGIFQSALGTPTYLPKNNPDGTPARWAGFDNLDVLLENYNVQTVSLRYIGNVYGDLNILPGLKLRSSWSLDYNNYNESEYWNDKTLLGLAPTNGTASNAITQNTTWINEQILTYRTRLGSAHNLGIIAGNTVQSNEITVNKATGSNFPNNSFTQISAAAVRTATQTWTSNRLVSFFSRLDYNYANKYFLEFSIRTDASSKFGKNNRWGTFPSLGAAWRVKEEKFLKNADWISELKIRGSYGMIGNQNGISDFAFSGLWSGTAGYPDAAGGADRPGTAPLQLSNPDLRWEKTKQADLGLDVSFLDDRIQLSVDLYRKYTTDLLLAVKAPSITGYSTYYSNAGEVSNKGIDISLTTVNIKTKNASWSTTFNVSSNVNKIEKLETPIIFGSRELLRHEEGYALNSFWMYKQLGVDPKTGDVIFEDVNGDGVINVEDRQILGNSNPKLYGGIINKVNWGGFDFNLLLTYQYGNKKVSFDRILGERGGTADANRFIFSTMLDRWQKEGDITDIPRLTSVGNNYGIEQTSRLLEDASFLRIASLSLGYSIPAAVLQKAKISNLRLYLQATNLWLFTKYMGPDPEVSHTYDTQGIDVGTSPLPRTVSFGINLTL